MVAVTVRVRVMQEHKQAFGNIQAGDLAHPN
jgi:hypothetical protein